jgi:hypothetical protein
LDATELSEKESMFQWETEKLQSLVRRDGHIQAAADKQKFSCALTLLQGFQHRPARLLAPALWGGSG